MPPPHTVYPSGAAGGSSGACCSQKETFGCERVKHMSDNVSSETKRPSSAGPTPEELCREFFDAAIAYARRLWCSQATLRDRLDLVDVESAAGSGLYRAAKSWDPSAGVPFEAWMRKHVGYEVKEEARAANTVRRAGIRKVRRLDNALRELTAELEREPTREELCAYMGVAEPELDEMYHLRESAREASALDGATLPAVESPDPTEAALVEEALSAFGPLTEDQRVIMALHYLEDVPFKEIASLLEQRPDQVSRAHSRARRSIRDWLIASEAA